MSIHHLTIGKLQKGCRRRMPPKLAPEPALLVAIRVPKANATQIGTRTRTSGGNTGAEEVSEVKKEQHKLKAEDYI